MTPLLAQLRTFAHDHDYQPRPDPATAELQRVLDLLRRRGIAVRAHAPGNDAYAHRLELDLDESARADAWVRFDLRAYVLLIYRIYGPLRRLAVDEPSLRMRCTGLLDALEEQGLQALGFEEAGSVLSQRMLAHGFIDNTVMAYFFESL